MRRFFAFRWLSLGGLLLFLAACGKGAGPAATPLDTPFALTQTAYVAAIRATQTARHGATRTAIMQMMLTGTPTPTAPAPTRTPFPIPSTAPPSPIPTAPTPTRAPPAAPTATATGNLYCREGPAPYYRPVTVLTPGQQVRIVGYNPVYYAYLYVEDPATGRACWAWRRWLHTDADETALHNLARPTPPPPPPGAFSLPRQTPRMAPFCPFFMGPALLVQVKNVSDVPVRSMELELEVLDSGAIYRTYAPDGIPTCQGLADAIAPHRVRTVAFRTRENLLEKRVRLTLKGCTEPDFRGNCVSYSVVWTIPKPYIPPFPFRP